MANQTYMVRLRKELRMIEKEPAPHITARPLPSNILVWHFVIHGPDNTVYAGGQFMGKLVFPEEYPYKPPAVFVVTPTGRFKSGQRLCLSMSDFHPETWNPLWSVSAVLTGLLSFMLGSEETVGSIKTNDAVKRRIALVTCHEYNRKDRTFRELFPDFVRDETEIAACAERANAAKEPGPTAPVRSDANEESLCSLLGWLAVFLGVLVALVQGYWKFSSGR